MSIPLLEATFPGVEAKVTDPGSIQYVAHKNGDITAFARLEMMYARQALAIAKKMTGNLQTAEDIVQEAWLRVLKNETFDPTKPFGSFFMRAVVTTCLDYFRRTKNARRLERSYQSYSEDAGDTIGNIPDPDSLEAKKTGQLSLDDLLEDMQPKYSEVMRLRAQGLHDDAVAQIIGKTEETAKWRYYEGIQMARMHARMRGYHVIADPPKPVQAKSPNNPQMHRTSSYVPVPLEQKNRKRSERRFSDKNERQELLTEAELLEDPQQQ